MTESSNPQNPVPLEEHRAYLYRLCLRFLHDSEEAEDATQQVLLQACAKGNAFRFEASPKTWLSHIARNHCLNRLRDQAREKGHLSLDDEEAHAREVPGPCPAPSTSVVDAVFYEQLLAAVMQKARTRKPPWDADDYLIFEAFYGNGKRTFPEVAAILEKPLEYVKYRFYQRLKSTLEEVGSQFEDCGKI